MKYLDTSLAPSDQYRLVTVVNNLVIYGGEELSIGKPSLLKKAGLKDD